MNCIRCHDAIVGDGTENGDGWLCADCRAELQDDEDQYCPSSQYPQAPSTEGKDEKK